jgi:hypothetical protein
MAKHERKNVPEKKPAAVDKSKQGCAFSFLNEERDELDPECGPTPEQVKEEYHQPNKEKEAGGEG